MHDPISEAAQRAAIDGAPAKVWHVGPNAAVEFGTTTHVHPFDGLTITSWSPADVAAGRSE